MMWTEIIRAERFYARCADVTTLMLKTSKTRTEHGTWKQGFCKYNIKNAAAIENLKHLIYDNINY